MSKQSIKATIDANIKQNGVQAITGQIMNSVLNQMVDNLAEEASTTDNLTELDNRTMLVICDSAASEPIKDISFPTEKVLSLEQLKRTRLLIMFTNGNSVYGNSVKLRINKDDSMVYPLYYGGDIITSENNLQKSPFIQQLFFTTYGDAIVYPLLSFASNMNDRSDKAVALKLLKESEDVIKNAISIPYSIIKTEGVVRYADGKVEFAPASMAGQYGCYPTDYINIEGCGEKLLLTQIAVKQSTSILGIAWYDAEKNFISGQMAETKASAIGYKEIEVSVPDGACFLRMNRWMDDQYDGAATDAFYILGTNQLNNLSKGGANEKGEIMIHPTTWLSTARNYILKEETINGVPYYMFSNDLGKTWKQLQNTIGDTMFVHWFADGSCMICSPSKAYWIDNTYSQINESIVYDYDGSIFVGNSRNFINIFFYDSPFCLISNKETAIWCDYGGPSGYIGRVWMTQDNGKTLRCICKNEETKLTNGSTMQVRHFHNTAWDEWEECLWLTTGDSPNECMLLAGKQNEDGSWSWDVKAKGSTFKFGQIEVDKNYLYLVADYTTGEPTGILKVVKSQVANPDAYSYIFKDAASTPYTGYMSDEAGHRLLTPDGIGYNKIYYAHGDFNFSEIPISFSDGKRLSFGWIEGWNYNGDIIIRVSTGYDITDLKLNGYMYNLSDAMRQAGYEDFGKMMRFL